MKDVLQQMSIQCHLTALMTSNDFSECTCPLLSETFLFDPNSNHIHHTESPSVFTAHPHWPCCQYEGKHDIKARQQAFPVMSVCLKYRKELLPSRHLGYLRLEQMLGNIHLIVKIAWKRRSICQSQNLAYKSYHNLSPNSQNYDQILSFRGLNKLV